MNYLHAKTLLLKNPPAIEPKLFIIEAAAMIAVAGILVRIFA